MAKNNEYASILPKKVFLSIFLFSLIMLAGKAIYSGFSALAESFGESEAKATLARANPREALADSAAHNESGRNSNADIALSLYRSENTRGAVADFYTELTGSREISDIILSYADENNISPSLAFALSWEESRFKSRAVNRNSDSVDRGLFQLNSKAFPNLSEEEMFDPAINAKNGLSHLRYCIDISGNEVAALAMYNAGTTAVRNGNTPKRTLDYISRVLSYRESADLALTQTVSASAL